jgi:3-isopropylmalate/(R)-2-methylmalate dehydratase small subunit
MKKLKIITGKGIAIRGDDIDTDRIIPARFLKEITFENMGRYAFYDERFDEKGNKKKHPFNDEKYRGGSILVVGKNFGCGSSREHAPQALMRFGIKAIIGVSFAEIFAGNSLMLGIPILTADEIKIKALMDNIETNPGDELTLDLEKKTAGSAGKIFDIDMNESARNAIMNGTWDSVSLMLDNGNEVKKIIDKIPYLNDFKTDDQEVQL